MDKIIAGCLYLMVIVPLWILADAYIGITGLAHIPNNYGYLFTLLAGLIGLRSRSTIKRRKAME